MLAVKLALQMVELARSRLNKRNGAKLAVEELKIVCPLAPGRHSLDNIHEVLIRILGDMERLNETQNEIEADVKERSQRLGDILAELRVQLARRNG